MKPLNQLVPDIFSTADKLFLQPKLAIQEIKKHQGVIPIAIIPSSDKPKVIWLDTSDYQFTEWKFRYSIQNLVANRDTNNCFTTYIQLLASDNILRDCLYPTGFIFQTSLCGSTLLARALSQSHHNIVINEGTPLHEPLWQYCTENWQQNIVITDNKLAIVRNIILAMGRRRTADQRDYFVKFRSWNTVFFDTIMKALPDVPCLFLYRNPTELLVSALKKEPTGYTRFKNDLPASFITGYPVELTTKMSYIDYFTSLYKQYFLSILKSSYKNIVYLNYNKLTKENLPKILQQAFHYIPSAEQMALMQNQFNYYSKDDNNTTHFVSDTARKQSQVVPEIQEVIEEKLITFYNQIEQSRKNLFTNLIKD